MASVSSVSNSYSSIYGNKNIITGLASGLDTEAMIEKSVSGYQLKIQQLQQQQTKLEWKQDAYRSITDKLINLSRNYTSYTSSTNLYSPSFFNQYNISAIGENAGAVSVSGKASSEVAINSVTRLATAAKYTVNAKDLGIMGSLTGGSLIDLSEMTSGSGISVVVDGVAKNYSLTGEGGLGLTDESTREDLVKALNSAVAKDFGEGKLAFKLDGGRLAVDSKNSAVIAGNSLVKVTSNYYGLGLGDGLSNSVDTSHTLGKLTEDGAWKKDADGNYEKRSLVINGVNVGEFGRDSTLADVISAINTSDAGVTVSYSSLTGEISFTAKETGSGGRIEFGDGLAKELFQTGATTPDEKLGNFSGFNSLWDSEGKATLSIGGKEIGTFTRYSTLQDLYDAINRQDLDFEVSTDGAGNIQVKDKKTGEAQADDALNKLLKITNSSGAELEKPSALFSGVKQYYTPGQDAELNVNINGTNMTLTRSSNTVDLDGLTVTLKDTFDGYAEGEATNKVASGAVKFETKTDTESIISGIKAFIDDYNALIVQIHDAYRTQPAEKSSSTHEKYEPLTDDEKATWSDDAIERYEEKAKQGILFGDTDLSMLYSKLTSMVSTALNSKEFKDLGIEASYDTTTRVSTLKINESKLTAALESNPDKVASFFTQTSADGSNTGLMGKMKTTLDAYASTSISTPGILVKKAGTTMSSNSLTNNAVQDQIDAIGNKISSWQTKMGDKIDYYTKQFTALETLIAKLNEQSSALAGLMGGY